MNFEQCLTFLKDKIYFRPLKFSLLFKLQNTGWPNNNIWVCNIYCNLMLISYLATLYSITRQL